MDQPQVLFVILGKTDARVQDDFVRTDLPLCQKPGAPQQIFRHFLHHVYVFALLLHISGRALAVH